MARRSSTDAVDGLLGLIDIALDGIEQGGGEADLRDLRLALFELTAVLERDPGTKAAGADLYAVAAAIVADCRGGLPVDPRKLRPLRERRRRVRIRASVSCGLDQAVSGLPL
jgi:hypothetical protein